MKNIYVMLAGLLIVSGCGNDNTNTGMEMGAGVDMKMMKPPVNSPPVYVGDDADAGSPANTSCKGMDEGLKGPTMDTLVKGKLLDFQDDDPVEGTKIKFYKTAQDVIDGNSYLESTTTNAQGEYEVTMPAGTPYRIIRGNKGGKAIVSGNRVDTIATYEFDQKWNDEKPVAVKLSTKQAIPGLVSVVQRDENGVLAGAVRDCDDKEMGGVTVVVKDKKVYDSEKDNQMFYFVDISGSTLPTRVAKWTDGKNGAFAALNVPPGVGTAVVKGVLGSGAAQEFSTAEVPILADSVTIVDLLLSNPSRQ